MDIANLVCRELDKRMEGLTAKYGLVYTRHCDHINISGKAIPESFKKQAKEIIRQSGFPLNTDKESLTNNADGHSVVGLNVNRKKPNVARNTKREWRKEKYKFDLLDVRPENIPEELKQHPYWCPWKLVYDQDDPSKKPRKIPVNPFTRQWLKPNEPEDWVDFEIWWQTELESNFKWYIFLNFDVSLAILFVILFLAVYIIKSFKNRRRLREMAQKETDSNPIED